MYTHAGASETGRPCLDRPVRSRHLRNGLQGIIPVPVPARLLPYFGNTTLSMT
jgi:hypothetical protein